MDECISVAKKVHQLESTGELSIVYKDLDNINGLCIEKNNQYLIVINSNLNYEKQLETAWHEAKHICSHVCCSNKENIEKEAIEFSKKIIQHPEVIELCRNAW
ncbi:putative transcriptional regulator [Clostridium botulinum C str. Eklund]|nr:putative transcriptional regulator [Clostridium botulinum C str. Eklund]NEZ49832.1 ImmA/IrrE family metallo-endopeptidase [Clostridium botulinum]